MNVTIVGSGYVGLVTGTCLAEAGNRIICVDNNVQKVKDMQSGKIPIYEPDLNTYFDRNIKENRLHFTTSLQEGIANATVIFLALPTPEGEDGAADLKYVLGVAEEIGNLLDHYAVIVNKSTVPVGTGDRVREAIAKNCKVPFDVVSNPEFLKEGMAVEDFMKPERVVIGSSSDKARTIMTELYEPFVRQGNPIIHMDIRSAELTKYAANAFLATKISFMNEIANLCELTGADVDMVRVGIGSDSRIGKRFLFAGIGYGGSCFPKDVKALDKTAQQYNYSFQIVQSVIEVNQRQRELFVQKIYRYYGQALAGKKAAIWGLAFKPNTDDIREAPALYVIDELLKQGVHITAYDPEAMPNVQRLYGDQIQFAEHQYDVFNDCDFLVIVTEWNAFRSPDFDRMSSSIRDKVIFDARNLYSIQTMEAHSFHYESVGRKNS